MFQKKNVKRQRIESTESESDSLDKSSEDVQTEIKVEKSKKPKTYDSPKNKSKTNVAKSETEMKTNIKKTGAEKKIKVEKQSPSPKKTPKADVKKSAAVKAYFTVKTEGDNKSTGVEKEDVKNGKDDVKVVSGE